MAWSNDSRVCKLKTERTDAHAALSIGDGVTMISHPKHDHPCGLSGRRDTESD